MTKICPAIKRDGSRCTQSVPPGAEYCHHHAPERAEERRRSASRAGSSKPDRELAGLREQLQEIADGTLAGDYDPRRAGVAVQALNVKARALELARKWRETEEIARDVEQIKEHVEQREEHTGW